MLLVAVLLGALAFAQAGLWDHHQDNDYYVSFLNNLIKPKHYIIY